MFGVRPAGNESGRRADCRGQRVDGNRPGEADATHAEAQLLRIEAPGSARARNAGVRAARGNILAFTDDDAMVDAGWLDALVGGFSDPAVAAVVGPVFELGSKPPAPLFRFSDYDPTRDSARFNRLADDWFQRLHFGAIGVGANLAIRRTAFDRHGLFREGLGRGAPITGDETYYLLMLVEEGETVVNQPEAHVYHPRLSAECAEQQQHCRFAYLLYVLLTRPGLRWRLATSLLRRVQGSSSSQPEKQGSVRELARAVLSAPSLVMAARRMDHDSTR